MQWLFTKFFTLVSTRVPPKTQPVILLRLSIITESAYSPAELARVWITPYSLGVTSVFALLTVGNIGLLLLLDQISNSKMLLRCHFICTIDLAYFKKCSSLLCIIPVQIYMRRLQQIIDGKARSSKYQKEAKCYNVKRPALTKYSARARLKHAANGSYDAIKGQQFCQLPTQMFANAFTSARYRQTSQHALGEKGY